MRKIVDGQLHSLITRRCIRPKDLEDVAIDEAQLVTGDAVEEALVRRLYVPRVEDGLEKVEIKSTNKSRTKIVLTA